MNLTEYNAMPDGDLKLAARTAVTMGWNVSTDYISGDLFVWDGNWDEFSPYAVFYDWNPFTDASIPYGLIGYGLVEEIGHEDELCYAEVFVRSEDSAGQGWVKRVEEVSESKTHAILNAFCDADPSGHWAKFLKGE